jgi:hypothetical protein
VSWRVSGCHTAGVEVLVNRNILLAVAAVLMAMDVVIHLRRSVIPDGNPFGSALHTQFFIYGTVALVLVICMFVAPMWLGSRAWLVQAALAVWVLGAVGAWLVAYHAPDPAGLVPDEGYVSKGLELLIAVILVASIVRDRATAPAANLGVSAKPGQ